MMVRFVLLGTVLFTSLFHLAYEGHRQRQLRLAIHRVQKEIIWAQDQWHIAHAHAQRAFFEVYRRPLSWELARPPLLAQSFDALRIEPGERSD